MSVPVLTVDGPSGAGKGTISRAIAQSLGWNYLDSGAIYRALGLMLMQHQVKLQNRAEVLGLAASLPLSFSSGEERKVYLDDRDVTLELQTEECGRTASEVAADPEVRSVLLQRQRDFRQLPGLVADGRDMGTVVFPDAAYKVFLTASLEARAERRYQQLKQQGLGVSLDKIRSDLSARDERDRSRDAAPLIRADDALEIDSSTLSIDEVLARVSEFVRGNLV